MDNKPEVIRHQMEETRASLADKIETLEEKVVGTVEGATSAVSETVDNVKDAVQGTVHSVQETWHDTVKAVKETFDLRQQVDRHPCLMMGASAALGYAVGRLLSRRSRRVSHEGNGRYQMRSMSGTWPTTRSSEPSHWMDEERRTAAASFTESEHARPTRGWLASLAPELAKFKGMAIGYLMGAVRDSVSDALPRDMRPQVKETMDSITQKLGGQPVHGPVLGAAPTSEPEGPEHRTTGGPYTEAQGRW